MGNGRCTARSPPPIHRLESRNSYLCSNISALTAYLQIVTPCVIAQRRFVTKISNLSLLLAATSKVLPLHTLTHLPVVP